jgi:hypothetical protein
MDIPPEVLAVLQSVELPLLLLPGINGIGLGMRESDGEVFDELAVRVLVDDASQLPTGLPEQVAGVDVCVIERRFEPFVDVPDLKRYSNLHGGIHITNPGMADDGTLGAIVRDVSAVSAGELLGLSCFHVVGDRGAQFPFTVWQPNHPPPFPDADPSDNIGKVRLASFPDAPVLTGVGQVRVGLLDAAVFTLESPASPSPSHRTISRTIMGENDQQPNLANAITGTAQAHTTMSVSKRGAMTRVTHGHVVAPYMSHPWPTLGAGRFILGSIEIRVDPLRTPDRIFCRKGDSGSIVLKSGGTTAVGMLWAGTPSGEHGLMTDIGLIESRLQISMT